MIVTFLLLADVRILKLNLMPAFASSYAGIFLLNSYHLFWIWRRRWVGFGGMEMS